MADLKPCPCGKTPEALGWTANTGGKWAIGYPDCCGEWAFEFRLNYETDPDKCAALAEGGWNGLTRATGPRIAQLEEALKKAIILLEAAACPQCGTKDGAYYDNNGDVAQCQWCYEVAELKALEAK